MNQLQNKKTLIPAIGLCLILLILTPLLIINLQKRQTTGSKAQTPVEQFHGLNVFIGYADNIRPNPDMPVPWNGSPNTNFIGSPEGYPFDGGAIRLENNSSQPITVQSVVVKFPNHEPFPPNWLMPLTRPVTFNLWGSFTVQPNTSTIITQTGEDPSFPYNFDTSDLVMPGITCDIWVGPDNSPPEIIITLSTGETVTLYDKGHILDTGGRDQAMCPGNPNESYSWTAIGTLNTKSTAIFTLELTPPSSQGVLGSPITLTATLKDTSNTLPLSDVKVDFAITGGPNLGKTDSMTTNQNGQATFSYTGTGMGEDNIKAMVTNASGGTLESNTVAVNWIMLTPTLPLTPTPSPTLTPTPSSTPTPTLPPTTLEATVFKHGIGSSGDNTNPDGKFSNKNPLYDEIEAGFELFNAQNQLAGAAKGDLEYEKELGGYHGVIVLNPDIFPPGSYTLKIKAGYHLKKLVPGIVTINSSQINILPQVHLVAGDADNSNALNILDYNFILACYSDLVAPVSCTPEQKVATDSNEDGAVNQFDYNLFLREIASQHGE